jgi:hypothetical protein
MMTGVTPLTGPAVIRFEARARSIDGSAIVQLPEQASRRLPSRGQVAVRGSLGSLGSLSGREFPTVLEPDGRKGHWLRLDHAGLGAGDLTGGERVSVAVTVTPDWPEPDVPADLADALAGAGPAIRGAWDDITPMARWEWVRWVNATAVPSTRRRRVEVTVDKLRNGKRRPCCFDLSACTDPALARNGKLRTD